MSAGSARRAGQKPPGSPDERVQQRLRAAEGAQAPWRGLQSGADRQQRIVNGRISGSFGVVISGDGFTMSKTGTGNYLITYTQAFATLPTVVATVENNAAGVYDVVYVDISTTTTTRIRIHSPAGGGAVDRAFGFVAIGDQTA